MRNRRDFLRMAGLSAGMTMLPPSIRKALAIPPSRVTGSIQDVEHVVILMQENRSFDHYFGTLRGVRGFNDPRPTLLPNGDTVWHQPPVVTPTKHYHSRGLSNDAKHVLPFYLNPMATTEFSPGTDHGWSSGHLAWNHGKYDQWVNQKQDVVTMGYLRRQDLGYHFALAEAFTLCDAYHCSVHSKTAPNRIYLWTGTVDARNIYGKKPNGPGMEERPRDGYTWTTYPERLEAAGVSWKLYQGGSGEPGTPTDNYTDNSLEFFAKYQVQEGADPASPLVKKGVSTHTLREFRRDVLSGTLPQVSWIVAPHQYSEHPEACPSDGAYYISLVLDALTANPKIWSKTVLFLNYDENDGQFDHIVPPMPPLTSRRNAQGMVSGELLDSLGDEILDLDKYPENKQPLIPNADPGGLQPIGLGPRVPMLIVSPWSTGGWVCSEIFDHTSVLRFLEKRFDVQETNISAWRRSVCGDLTSAFDFSSPPDPTAIRFTAPKLIASLHQPYTLSAEQTMPTQEFGTRRARALPYRFQAQARVERSGNELAGTKLWIDLSNSGTAGVAFYIYNRLRTDEAPRRYTVAAGDVLSDYWTPQGTYDLRIHGPNGFLCHFRGDVSTNPDKNIEPEVHMRYDSTNREMILSLENTSPVPCKVQTANSYSQEAPRTLLIASGSTLEDRWSLSISSGWYDLTVVTETSPGYSRRFAGHAETGRPSTSDLAAHG